MATIRAMPILEVADIGRSLPFYESLGFDSHGTWGDPPEFVIVQRGDVTVGLKVPRNTAPVHNEWWSAYLYVDDAPALHEELSSAGIPVEELVKQEFGLIDFDVIDPDGHRLAFGSDPSRSPHGPGLGADRGRG